MAYTVPETLASLDSRVTPGERRVFIALRDHLPEDCLVYYDMPGLVVLEVKDWRLRIGARLARGVSPEDILVLGHNRLGMEKIAGWLDGQQIPASFLPDRRVDGTSTIHSSKGLDAGHVLILNAYEADGLRTPEEARRLLYIGMTRARDEPCITFARPSWLMDELAQAIQAKSDP